MPVAACPNCGAKTTTVPGLQVRCGYCGTAYMLAEKVAEVPYRPGLEPPLDLPDTPPPRPAPEPEPDRSPDLLAEYRRRKRRKKVPTSVYVAVSCLVLSGLVFWLVLWKIGKLQEAKREAEAARAAPPAKEGGKQSGTKGRRLAPPRAGPAPTAEREGMSWSAFDTAEYLERRGVFEDVQPSGTSRQSYGYPPGLDRGDTPAIVTEYPTAADARSAARQEGAWAWGRLTIRADGDTLALIKEELK